MKRVFYFSVALIFLMAGCYPAGPEYYEELDVVYTNYDDEFDFASKETYSMPDKIVKITGNLVEGDDPEFVKEPYNTQMLQRIEGNMSNLGYAKSDNPESADLTLFPVVWTNTTITYWYDYWCWWNPYYCGWGWGYPYVSSYTTGTLVMTLVADGGVEPVVAWTAAANGLLSGYFDITRVNKAIDQAFEQSPYLSRKTPK